FELRGVLPVPLVEIAVPIALLSLVFQAVRLVAPKGDNRLIVENLSNPTGHGITVNDPVVITDSRRLLPQTLKGYHAIRQAAGHQGGRVVRLREVANQDDLVSREELV